MPCNRKLKATNKIALCVLFSRRMYPKYELRTRWIAVIHHIFVVNFILIWWNMIKSKYAIVSTYELIESHLTGTYHLNAIFEEKKTNRTHENGAVDCRSLLVGSCLYNHNCCTILNLEPKNVEQKSMNKKKTQNSNIKHERKHGALNFTSFIGKHAFGCQKIDMNGLNFTCHHSTFRVLSCIFCAL